MTLRSLRLALFVLIAFARPVHAQTGGELHFCLHGEPKTFNPILVDDEASENIRYLTGGVLIRLNRQTQALEPGLSSSERVDQTRTTLSLQIAVIRSPAGAKDTATTETLLGKLIAFSCRADWASAAIGMQQSSGKLAM